ncbi:MAG: sensor histidine kinase [Roseibium sp.]|nr:sensor histidine kinase [Roseibium sp.]
MSKRVLLLGLPPIVLLAIAAALAYVSVEWDEAAADRTAAERLTLYRQTILGEYNKFRYLPYMIARDTRATNVLGLGQTDASANRFLEEMADNAGASLLYVMDRSGTTLAASNWADELSLVGRNYAFRPYFQSAIAGDEGRFFAIGATLGEPGLFLARPTPVSGEPLGVAVVKVDMRGLERAWAEGGETVFATDRNGIIFLSSVADWRYKSLAPVPGPVRAAIDETRQYATQPLTPLTNTADPAAEVLTIDGRAFRHTVADVGLLDWQLHFLVPVEAARQTVWPIWAGAIGLSLLYIVALLMLRGRALRRASAVLLQESAGLRELNRRLTDEVEERKRVEAELIKAQEGLARSNRLAAVGQMSAAVAHELNQPLAALRMFVAGTRKFLQKQDLGAARDNLDEIESLQERMAALTQELKRFARPSESRIERIDLRDSLKAVEKIARPRFDETGVSLSMDLPDEALTLETARLRVEQILLNLLRNGAEAAGQAHEQSGGGTVHVSARQDGAAVRISVSDNGVGVPEELRERIFDPFFTTKLSSGGLGLGLSISGRIADDLGGSLEVSSNPQGGATFLLRLPGGTGQRPPAGVSGVREPEPAE